MNTSATNPESSNETDHGISAGPGSETGSASDATSDGSAGSASSAGATDAAGSAAWDRDGSYGPGAAPLFGSRELSRPVNDRMLAGVASGLARYVNVDVTLVRVILVVLVFLGGMGVPIYLAGWLLIPEEGADRSIASDLVGSLENRSR